MNEALYFLCLWGSHSSFTISHVTFWGAIQDSNIVLRTTWGSEQVRSYPGCWTRCGRFTSHMCRSPIGGQGPLHKVFRTCTKSGGPESVRCEPTTACPRSFIKLCVLSPTVKYVSSHTVCNEHPVFPMLQPSLADRQACFLPIQPCSIHFPQGSFLGTLHKDCFEVVFSVLMPVGQLLQSNTNCCSVGCSSS